MKPKIHRKTSQRFLEIYRALYAAYGPQGWWPAQTRMEMAIGAILTQNTSWKNVQKAIVNLRSANLLNPRALARIPEKKLAGLIKPSGFFRIKAKRLKTFVRTLQEDYQGKLSHLFSLPPGEEREALLRIPGIGPETADSIILYGGGHPVFVIDAYTRRIFSRIGLIDPKASYEKVRSHFESQLPKKAPLYKEYHALLVRHAKVRCLKNKPLCHGCPLEHTCLKKV